MKRILLAMLFLLIAVGNLRAFIASYRGPRALALGYASIAFTYDGNAIFLNPAFLAAISSSLSGYQYNSSYRDFDQAADNLSELAAMPLTDFESLSTTQKTQALDLLKNVYSANTLMTGFHEKMPMFVTAGYGVAISFIDSATLTPVASNISFSDPDLISNEDIAALQLEYIGINLKRYTVAYGMQLSSSMYAGVAAHYLHGKTIRFTQSILSTPFATNGDVSDYLSYAWDKADFSATCLTFDVGLALQAGDSFTIAVTARNVTRPELKTVSTPIQLERRVIAGLAFKPSTHWGIYIDADITPFDLYGNGVKYQPVSLGIEAGFFGNSVFLRAGMHNDLKEKHFFGAQANPLFGAGLGFNLKKLLADVGLGLDSHGRIRDLAISLSLLLQ